MSPTLHILIVEDSVSDARLVARELQLAGRTVHWERVDSAADLQAALARQQWDAVLCDYSLPGFSGREALDIVRQRAGDVPFIFVSGTIGEDVAVAAMQAGAHDYVLKHSLKRLAPAIERELQEAARRRAHRRRQETLRLQAAALTAAANAILIADRQGAIEWVNPAFTRLTGYSAAEAIGRNPPELLRSGQHASAEYQELWDAILAGRVWTGELINRRKDGSTYPEEQTITPVCDEDGTITHFIAIKHDLTERKQAEEVLRRRAEELERFHRLSVGRELQMIALKRQINALAAELGRPPPHDLSFLPAPGSPPPASAPFSSTRNKPDDEHPD